jgi:signal transduction histidine kinase
MTEGLLQAWRRVRGSVAFRLTLNYSFLAVGTTILLLIFVYGKVADVFETQFSRQITLTTQRLAVHSEDRGRVALQREITQLLSDQTDIDAEMYLLLDEHGRKLAGNLDVFAALDLVRDPPQPLRVIVRRDGAPVDGFVAVRKLDDGSVLAVGRDTHDLKEINALIGKAVVAATIVALFLVLIGTFIFRQELRRRIEDIRDTAVQVGTGELTRRIPDASEQDEFAQLRHDINHMLDRIETLMRGVRNVSDSIAHNVRTPLARVLAKLHKAQQSRGDADALAATIDAASNEIMDLIAMSEKLLLIAEAESGVRRQTFEPVQLERIVRDVIDLYEPLADQRGIVLKHHSTANPQAADGTWVLADADLMAGVLVNLVDNALKYAGDGARISIATGSRGNTAKLAVRDNGPGVAEPHLALLGTRFYRVAPELPGSGLGLASVRAVTSLHEGTLRFLNGNPGFTVHIELPLIAHP